MKIEVLEGVILQSNLERVNINFKDRFAWPWIQQIAATLELYQAAAFIPFLEV